MKADALLGEGGQMPLRLQIDQLYSRTIRPTLEALHSVNSID